MWCRTVDVEAHHPCRVLLQALFITASMLTVTSTTATRTMTKVIPPFGGSIPPAPASQSGLRRFSLQCAEKPAVGGLLASSGESPVSRIRYFFGPLCRKSPRSSALWPFSGETSRRLGSIILRGRVGSKHDRARGVRKQTSNGGRPVDVHNARASRLPAVNIL